MTRASKSRARSFPPQIVEDLLCRVEWVRDCRIDNDLRIGGRFVRVGNACEMWQNPGARFGIESLAIALFTDVEWRRYVNENEPADRRYHAAHLFAQAVVRRNWRTERGPEFTCSIEDIAATTGPIST
jgi:hypothetical protein